MATFPTTADQLTTEFFSTVLSANVAAFDVQLVEAQGAMTTAARIELHYAGDAPADAPSAIFAKWASPIPAVQQMATANGMYRREVRFYKDLASSSGLDVPRSYFGDWDRETGLFLLLLEDMSGSQVGDLFASRVDEVRPVVEAIPAFHARWWNHPDLDGLRWLFPVDHPAVIKGLGATFAASLNGASTKFPQAFGGALGNLSQRIAADYGAMAKRFGARPRTLVHGDLHLQQVFFPLNGPGDQSGRFAIFDWQTIGRGFGGQDLARIIAACLSPEDRRAHERDLVASYHAGLIANGVGDYSLEQCWDDYRLGVLWSIVTNVIAGASIDGDAMDALARPAGTTFIEGFFGRLDAAIADLEVDALLD
ncbi:MAG: DUF1679 domain-containing protein [Dehalococcoidia bacterium]|jgi:hypothetical protein|nr:DUF1679 domain-containing protein [Dehalococcoidia bacterium]